MLRLLLAICALFSLTKSQQSNERLNILTNTLLQELMNRIANSESVDDLNDSPYEIVNPVRVASDYDLNPFRYQARDDLVLRQQQLPEPQSFPRSTDYFGPVSLWGPQYAIPRTETIQAPPPPPIPAKFLQKQNELIAVKRAVKKSQPPNTSDDALTAQLDNLKQQKSKQQQQQKQNTESNIGKEKV